MELKNDRERLHKLGEPGAVPAVSFRRISFGIMIGRGPYELHVKSVYPVSIWVEV